MSDNRILIVAAVAPLLVLLGMLVMLQSSGRPGIPVTAEAIDLRK